MKLFSSSLEVIDLLNQVAPFYFSQVQQLMFNDLVLHINRLTYAKKTGKYEYLTVRRLPDLEAEERRKQRLQEVVNEAVECTRFSGDRRNRYIAHRSLQLFTDPNARKVDPIQETQIAEGIGKIWNIITYIESEYFNSGMIDDVIYPLGGADSLLYKLKKVNA